MKKLAALIIILSLSSPLHAEYDPQHTMLALNMAIVSVNRILTAESRAVLEQEYSSIINNLSLGNIESDSEMTALYRDLMTVITSKRLRSEDSRRLLTYYDTAEKRLVSYALSSIRTREAQLRSAQNEAQASSQGIARVNSEQNAIIAGWLGNMAVSCISSFFGGIFSPSELLNDTVNAYDSYQRLELIRGRYESDLQRANSQAEISRAQISGLRDELKHDSAMLKEELRNTQWLLDRQEISECDSLQQRLLTASWNLLRKDPYKVEAEKYRVRKLADDDPQKNSREILDGLEVIRSNTPKDDWANNIFAGLAFFVMGDKEQGVECLELNVDFAYETEISGALLAEMKKGRLDSESAQEVSRSLRLGALTKGMSDDVKARAEALADFFDGVDGAVKNLESLSRSAGSPSIFHALRIAEQMKGGTQDFGKVVGLMKAHDGLRDEIYGDYSAVMPVVMSCASADSVNAKIFMADSLLYGWGIEKDVKKAEEIFTGLAESGNAYAQFVIVQSHFAGQKYEAQKKYTPQKLERIFQEGRRYFNGQGGVPIDNAKAAELFTIAAENGHSEAQRLLGFCYKFGYGVSKDLQNARYWYQQAANQGNKVARIQLDDLNRTGR